MTSKKNLLVNYFNNLVEPISPPKAQEESLTEEITVEPLRRHSPPSPASVREMLTKQRDKQKSKSEIIEESLNSGGIPPELIDNPSLLLRQHPEPVEMPITDRIIELAESAAEKLLNGDDFNPEEQDILEAIVIPGKRPVLDIIDGNYSEPPADWEFLNDYRQNIISALPGIGRIDVPELLTIPYAGTGFFVGKNILLTNRHVARLFVHGAGKGAKYLTFQAQISPQFNLKYEVSENPAENEKHRFKIVEPLLIHPHWDAAFLRVEPIGDTPLPAPLRLAKTPPGKFDDGEMQHVFVVGYPMFDPRNNEAEQMNIFRRIFGRKRLMPGYLNGYHDVRTGWNSTMRASVHDASTLGGNSGSAVINLITGEVLALHFGGKYLIANYGVPTWELAKDPHVSELDLNFTSGDQVIAGGPQSEPPIWINSWNDLKPLKPDPVSIENTPPLSSGDIGETNTLSETSVLPVGSDWFEQISDAALVEAMRSEPAKAEKLIRQTLYPNEADDLITDLNQIINHQRIAATTEEGILDVFRGSAPVDPSLPEIVFLHGIMGGHLASHNGWGGRVWLSALGFVSGKVAQQLMLADDGEHDKISSQTLYPDGHLRMVYEKPARKWRMQGFVVHEFSFDWRKSIFNAADRLHFFIESLRLERPAKKFALVCHSMGGLVAAVYANRHPEWSSRISQSIFMGAPLRGSYIPIEAFLGTYPLLSKFSLVDLSASLEDYMQMAATMPGLIEMLPDPAIFPDAAGLYERASWKKKDLVPVQMWLDQSRRLKQILAASPILEGAHLIASANHPTISEVSYENGNLILGKRNRRGDGTVPIQSATAAGASGVKVYGATYGHGDLPREPEVIAAISDILRNGRCQLPLLSQAMINDESLIEEAPTESIEEASSLDFSRRLGQGILTQRDVDYLLRTDHSTFPGTV